MCTTIAQEWLLIVVCRSGLAEGGCHVTGVAEDTRNA